MQIKKSSFFAIIILVNGLFFAFGMLVATWLNTQHINNNTSDLVVPNISTTDENIVANPGSEKINSEKKQETYKLDGTYISSSDIGTDAPAYTFDSKGNVFCIGNSEKNGKYVIDGNNVNITYSFEILPGETEKTSINEKDKFVIVNNETIIKNEIKFIKQKSVSKDELVGKWYIDAEYTLDILGVDISTLGLGTIEPKILEFKEDGTYVDSIAPASHSSEYAEDYTGTYELISNDIQTKVQLTSNSDKTIEYRILDNKIAYMLIMEGQTLQYIYLTK